MVAAPHPRHRWRADEPVQSVTTAAESLAEEQAHRIRRYLVTMGIRTVCFVLAVVTSGWLRWACVSLAVVLPYIAVVLANAVSPRVLGRVPPVPPTGEVPPQLGK